MAKRNHPFVAEFTDKFGETRKVHRQRGSRLAVARTTNTPILALTSAVTELLGAAIKRERTKQGMTLVALACKAGLTQASKERMYDIESGTNGGVRLGTLYALAIALGIPLTKLLPSVEQVLQASGVTMASEEKLSV